MLSNVSKSADVLRGATQMQDLWAEIEKMAPAKALKPPRVLSNRLMVGTAKRAVEERENLERKSHRRQQKTNWHMSEHQRQLDLERRGLATSSKRNRRPQSERKALLNRLATSKTPPRPKSPTGLGHILKSGELAPGKAALVPRLDVRCKSQREEEPQHEAEASNMQVEPQSTGGGWGGGWGSWFGGAPASAEERVTFTDKARPGDSTAKSSAPSVRKGAAPKQGGALSNRSRSGQESSRSNRSRTSRTSFGGLSLEDFYHDDWKPCVQPSSHLLATCGRTYI